MAYESIPNWIHYDPVQKIMVSCAEIKKLVKIGPFLAPQVSSLNKNIDFPLYIQMSNNLKLWIDQTDKTKCNWLSLIPVSQFSYNLIARQISEKIYFIAFKDIKVGQELKVWYEPYYSRNIPSDVLRRINLLQKKSEKMNIEFEKDKKVINIEHVSYPDMTLSNHSIIGNDIQNFETYMIPNVVTENDYFSNTNTVCVVPEPLHTTFSNSDVILSQSNAILSESDALSVPLKHAEVVVTASEIDSFPVLHTINASTDFSDLHQRQCLSSIEVLEIEEGIGTSINKPAMNEEDRNIERNMVLRFKNHFSLPSLKAVAICKGKVMFTHDFTSNLDVGRKLEEKVKKYIVMTKPDGESRHKWNVFPPKDVMKYVYLGDEHDFNLHKDGYDMVTLSFNDTLQYPDLPETKVIKKHKLNDISNWQGEFGAKSGSDASGNTFVRKCSQCAEVFYKSSIFAQHLKDHLLVYLRRRFPCDICHRTFKKNELRIHKRNYHNGNNKLMGRPKYDWNNPPIPQNLERRSRVWQGGFGCPICKRKFTNSNHLLRHLAKHTGEFACSLCFKTFARNETLKKHLCLDDVEESSLECRVCNKSFDSSRACQKHTARHGEDIAYYEKLKCSWCLCVFLDEELLATHRAECVYDPQKRGQNFEEEPKGRSKFCCHICGRNFSILLFWQNHVAFCKQVNDVGESGEAKCLECGVVMPSAEELRTHIKTHTHPLTCTRCEHRFKARGTYEIHNCSSELLCDLCGKSFRSLQKLFRHVTEHNPPPFACATCRCPFYYKSSLCSHSCCLQILPWAEAHEATRSCVRCPRCPAVFAAAHNLKKHMTSFHESASQQPRYPCNECNKTFCRPDLLRIHKRIHDAPKLRCRECGKAFRSQRAADNHAAAHKANQAPPVKFACSYCHMGFSLKRDLCRHEKSHTDIDGGETLVIEHPDATEMEESRWTSMIERQLQFESRQDDTQNEIHGVTVDDGVVVIHSDVRKSQIQDVFY